jgi:hypothetical protein
LDGRISNEQFTNATSLPLATLSQGRLALMRDCIHSIQSSTQFFVFCGSIKSKSSLLVLKTFQEFQSIQASLLATCHTEKRQIGPTFFQSPGLDQLNIFISSCSCSSNAVNECMLNSHQNQ